MKKTIMCLLVLLLVAGGVVLTRKHWREAEEAAAVAKNAKSAAVTVLLTNVTTMTVPVELSTFGTVEPLTTVAVKPQITGILSKVLFDEGREVQAGDVLFTVDSRGPEASLKQAEAVLLRDRVQWENAIKEAGRREVLLKKGVLTQEAYDGAVTAVEMFKATVQSDEAAVDNARLLLSYCSIRAPVAGRTGNLAVHPGNLIRADDTTLVTINQIHPILVRFVLPQLELARVQGHVQGGGLMVVVAPVGVGVHAETGAVTFVDNAVDEATGTIQLKARFENTLESLWPGQFVKVVLRFALQENAVVVPESAVLFGQQGAYVYVTDKGGRAVPRFVTVDRTVAGLSVIASGLVSGEEVVVDGQLRIKPGALVKSPSSPRPASVPAGRP
jgi:multidrug efflux system membrane fusion protein